MIIDVKEYVLTLASFSQLQIVRGEFERPYALPGAKRTDNVRMMTMLSKFSKCSTLSNVILVLTLFNELFRS